MQKYSSRYRNKVKDFLHKLTTELANEFRDYEHGFENLEKERNVWKMQKQRIGLSPSKIGSR